MKIDKEIIQDLRRYFNADIIGSYTFVELGLLSKVDDIDFCTPSGNIDNFLKDRGYTVAYRDVYFLDINSKQTLATKYVREGYIPLHRLYIKRKDIVTDEHEVLAYKLKRGRLRDLVQVREIVDNLIKNKNE